MIRTVLITGAAGFLGSNLAEHYLNQGCDVVGIDNFSSSRRNSEHLQKLCKNQNFTILEGDVCNTAALRQLCNWKRFDLILNAACPASPPTYQKIPVETLMTSVLGTKNILDVAEDQRATTRVIHFSTSEVYGEPLSSPQDEKLWCHINSYGIRSCYDAGKSAAEALCFDYLHKFGVDVRVIRIFNTYGPNMDPNDGRVVTNFIKQALRNEPMTIYGDGSQTRSLCYVDDLVAGITSLANLDKNPQTPINLGNPCEVTMNELASKVQTLLPTQSRCDHLQLPKDDPTRRCPDISLAKSLLSWEPKVDLSSGLTRTIDYMKAIVSPI